MNSLKTSARLTGLFWILIVAITSFSLFYVRSKLIVSGDAAATATNIMTNESLFRMAIVGILFTEVFRLFFGLTGFRLFKGVNKTWATVFLTSILISVAIAFVNALNNIAALVVLSKAEYLIVFQQEQLNAIMMIFLKLNNFGQGILEIFWWPYLFSLGLLIVKSRFIPRIFGVFLMIGSFGLPINTFSLLLIPLSHPAIILQLTKIFMVLGALPTMFWLLIMGVKEQQQISKD